MNPEWIGYIAAFLTTAAYIPQARKAIVEKHTKSLSLGMYILITTGLAMWLVYGILIDDLPMILANGITVVLAAAILAMKIKHG